MMMEYKTTSQCISSDYCKGWNDAVKKAEKENKELKEMLKTALTTVNSVCYCLSGNCNHCAYDSDKDECDNSDGFKWVHEKQALKLIGGEEQ